MAFNESISNRIREALADAKDVEEKLMFGGVCYMVDGKMCVGVIGDEMMCRIGPEKMDEALSKPGCRPMDFAKRPMEGYVYVDEDGMKKAAQFKYWIGLCLDFNPKAKASKKKK
jgi:TfoX/Sxy family transcriptional regulator of competence genes